MKYNKGHNAAIVYRAAWIDDHVMWVGIFDDNLCYDSMIRENNVKRAVVNDWKITYRGRIRKWSGVDVYEM
jgi:hypothetical protein